MKFCDAHWAALAQAIDVRGLAHLVTHTPDEIHRRLRLEFSGDAPDDDYDPLCMAHWVIASSAVEHLGLRVLLGDLCPLCEGEEESPGLAGNIIGAVADLQLQEARALKLVTRLQ